MPAARVPLSASHKDQKPIPATGFVLSGLVAWMLLSSQRQSQKSKFCEKRLSKTGEKGLTSLLSWRKGSVGTLDAGGHGQRMLSGWMHLLLKMNRACLHLSGYTCSHQARNSLVLQSYACNSLPENLEAQSPPDWVKIPRYRPWPPVALTQANSSLASSYRQAWPQGRSARSLSCSRLKPFVSVEIKK